MKPILSLLVLFNFFGLPVFGADSALVNVVWIVIEDASPHVGCYGETLIKTPHIDRIGGFGACVCYPPFTILSHDSIAASLS
jgi:hypothetical protein